MSATKIARGQAAEPMQVHPFLETSSGKGPEPDSPKDPCAIGFRPHHSAQNGPTKTSESARAIHSYGFRFHALRVQIKIFFLLFLVSFLHEPISALCHSSIGTQGSSIILQESGGNTPIKKIVFELSDEGGETFLKVQKYEWEKSEPISTERIQVPSSVLKEVWAWIEKEKIRDLKDVEYPAEDEITYDFFLKKGNFLKHIRAMGVTTLENRKYFYFYCLIDEIYKKYLPHKE